MTEVVTKKEEVLENLECDLSVSTGYEDYCYQAEYGERYTWVSENSQLVDYSSHLERSLDNVREEIERCGMPLTDKIEGEIEKVQELVDEKCSEAHKHLQAILGLDDEIQGLIQDFESSLPGVVIEEAERLSEKDFLIEE